jgi:fibronectin-binding autotransporter adhesin
MRRFLIRLIGLAALTAIPVCIQAAGFTIDGATVTLSAGEELFTDADLTISSGSFIGNNSTVTVSGSLINSGGSFSLGTSTVVFNGAAAGQTINPGRSPFYRIVITGVGDWSTSVNPVTVSSTVVISAGSLIVASGSTMTVLGSLDVPAGGTLTINADLRVNGGSLTNKGVINSANDAALLTLPAAGFLGGSGSTILPGLALPNAAQTTTLSGPISLLGTLTNGTGHLLDANSLGNFAITVSSSWVNSGTYIARTSSVSFNGSGSGLTINPGISSFYALAITGPGSWSTVSNPITISSAALISAGTLTITGGSSVTIAGTLDVQTGGSLALQNNLLINGGSLTNAGTITSVASSTITLVGSGTLGGGGSSILPHVLLNGSGQTTTLGGDITTLGQLLLSSGHTLDANPSGNYQVTISSNWTNAGIFQPRAGTVEFTSTATLTGQTTFYNLSALTPGFTLTFPAASTQTVTGAVTFAGTSTNLIKLRSSISGSYWFLKSTGSDSIYAVDVKDSVASANTLDASASLNSTHNVNWTFGTTRTWVGPGNWSSAANWNPVGVPGGNDSALFANANNCTIDISTSVATLTMQAGYSGTITANLPLTLSGGYSQAGGTFGLGGSTLTVGSNWNVTGGTFNAGTGTVLFNAASSGRQIRNSGRSFYVVDFNGSGGYWTLQDSMTVRASLLLDAGTLDTSVSGNYGILVGREWLTTGGSLNAHLSTTTFTGATTNLRIQSGGNVFGYFTMTGTGSWITNNGPVELTNAFTLAAGSFTVAAGSSLTVGGNMIVQSGTSLALQEDTTINGGSLQNAGTITATATPTLTITGTGVLGGTGVTRLPAVTLAGNTQATTLGGAVTIQGALINGAGHTLDASVGGNYGVTLSSSWLNAGIYMARTSSVSFNGSMPGLQIDPGPSSFYKIQFTGSGSWSTANNPLTVSSVVYITAGNLSVTASSSMTVTGNVFLAAGAGMILRNDVGITGGTLSNAGMVTGTDASRTLSLTGTGTLGGSGATLLPRLDLSGAAQTTLLAGPVTLLGDLANGTGHTLDVGAGGNYNLTVSSSWVNSGTYLARTSSVSFSGSSSGLVIVSGQSPFYKLIVTGVGAWATASQPLTISSTVVLAAGSLIVATGSTMTVSGSVTVQSGATLDIEDDFGLLGNGGLSNAGTVTSASSTALFTSSGSAIVGGSGTTLFPRAFFTGTGQTTTLAGPISILGDLANAAGHSLDANSTGNFAITVSSSWLNAGTYLSRTSSVTFNGSATGLLLNPGASRFYTLAIAGLGTWTTATNPLTVANSATVAGGMLSVGSSSSMTVTGILSVQSGGTLDLQNNLLVSGGSLTNAGTLTSITTSSLTLTGTGTLGGTGASMLPHVILVGSGQTTTLGGDIAVQGQLTTSAGHILDVNNVGNYQITVSSNWTNSGTFLSQSGTVIFNATATFAGLSSFYNLAATTPGITLTLTIGSTQTVTGNLTLTGAAGNLIALRTTTAGTRAFLKSLGSASLSYLDVKDNSATGTVLNAAASTDSGNNLNWVFATTRVWKGVTTTAWNLPGNWSPVGIPATVDSVVFDNTSTRNCSINLTSATVTGFTMTGSNARTISFSAGTVKLTVLGDLTIGAGVFNQGTSAVTVSGSWIKSGGTYTAGTSTVTFSGSSLGNVISSGGTAFFRIGFNGPGQWSTTGTALTVSSHVVMTNGTLTIASGSSMTIAGAMDVGSLATLDIQNDFGINGGSLTNAGIVSAQPQALLTLVGAGALGGTGSTILPAMTLTGAAQTTTLAGPVTIQGTLSIGASHTLDVNNAGNYQITASSDWLNSGTFTARTGSVVFNASASLTGSTSFFNFTAATPGTTLTFAASSIQTISGTYLITGAIGNRIQLLSSSGSPYSIQVTGTSSVSQVAVAHAVASGKTIYAGQPSLDNGGNSNWVFDYPPNDVTDLSAAAQANGDVTLTWTAPADADDNPLGSGSRYVIEWSTYAVAWSTSNAGDTGYGLTNHVTISTSGVSPGDSQVVISTGLTGNTTYYFRIWTQDPLAIWSQALSNGTTAPVALVLSVQFGAAAYNFGIVSMGASTISTSAITVTNYGNASQTYALSASTTGATVWSIGVATPTIMDRFVVFGNFNSSQPSSTTFVNLDVITSTPTAASASVYSGDQLGVAAAPATQKTLWLRLDMPPSTTVTNVQQFNLVVTASSP